MSYVQDAIEFRKAFELPSDYSSANFDLQQRLIAEEFVEVIEACAIARAECGPSSHEELLKELADLVLVCFQMAALMEWDLDEAMKRVFKSNMSKLGEDGRPVRRGDGKVLKGPNYEPPNLRDLVKSPW